MEETNTGITQPQSGSKESNDFDFGEAISRLKSGFKLSREGWNGNSII